MASTMTRNWPHEEVVLQLGFDRNTRAGILKQLASGYEAQGWTNRDLQSLQVAVRQLVQQGPITEQELLGYQLTSPAGVEVLQLRASEISMCTTDFKSWAGFTGVAHAASQRYLDAARPNTITEVAARFICRIPWDGSADAFRQLLRRPAIHIDELPHATVSDFLHRDTLVGLDAGFMAQLTLQSVPAVSLPSARDGVICLTLELRKPCALGPRFDAVLPDLEALRRLQQTLLRGSFTRAATERFPVA